MYGIEIRFPEKKRKYFFPDKDIHYLSGQDKDMKMFYSCELTVSPPEWEEMWAEIVINPELTVFDMDKISVSVWIYTRFSAS